MKKFLLLALFLTTATIFAQGTITGTVVGSEMSGPLPGANVQVVGTTNGTIADFDGNFSLNVTSTSGTIEISYLGFEKQSLQFNVAKGETKSLGSIVLKAEANALNEIVVTSFSLAIDRKTPVAVSTISAEKIETKIGNQEFPEILKSTPGVYATKSGGGFGDASMRLRGFNSENIAVMINGVPVNDMENGRVYWSNWAGLTDVTRTMQVQRGLGASKVAVPSIGGTVNIVTKSTDMEEGGNVFGSVGNDGLKKFGFTVATGKSDNGWAATVAASKTSGERFADGLQFEGYSYFVNIAKEINEDHLISLTAFGAPQRHGQRETSYSIEDYQRSDRGIKFNGDWGYKNGQITNVQDNFYHKPQISLNHYWNISDKTDLSTAAYVSFGTGGGGGYTGDANLRNATNSAYRVADYQPLQLDRVQAENAANGADGAGTILYDSRNDHNWYGALSTLSTKITENIELSGGVDLRYYKGEHFREVKDLLGGQYWADDNDVNNPNNLTQVGDIMSYHNDGVVLWEGLFAQAEYVKDDLSAFVSVAASNTSYQRKDYFLYTNDDPIQETDFVNFFGYSAKGGANYNVTATSNFFANIGYFEKAPFLNAVFLNNTNELNKGAKNQKIFSAELGYGFRTADFRANVNVYRTSWQDRTFIKTLRGQGDEYFTANILGVDAIHQGVEIDLDYRATAKLTLTAMASIGDYKWANNVTDVVIFDENNVPINADNPIDIYIKDTPVGDAAQTTMALGMNYEVFPRTYVRADFTYNDRYFADFEPTDRTKPDVADPWQAPSFGLLDLGLTHKFKFGAFDATLNANLFNALDTEYIADARDGRDHDANTASVWYGFGRTYTVGTKIKF